MSMLSIVFSLFQLAMPTIVSLIAASYLHEVTQPLLRDLCGTENRARFWSRCIVVVILTVPLMLVLLVTEVPKYNTSESTGYAMLILRQTMAWTAGGILAAVGIIAYVVKQYVPTRERKQEWNHD